MVVFTGPPLLDYQDNGSPIIKKELVNESGQESGPRAQRASEIS
ncbi:MAG: hypothetical protein K0S79_893 [Nitrospira sp.]|jgi:hypothetical protein|nr:hypothetical protein [Nitrospira sp.]